MLKVSYEQKISERATSVIDEVVNYANEFGGDDQQRLDHVKAHLISRFSDFWIYRGGNHVGVHLVDGSGLPVPGRAVLIVVGD